VSKGFSSRPRRPYTNHGMRGTRIYRTWVAMCNRCENPGNDGFRRYGARGIRVCERWQSFLNFFEDMGEPPQGMTLDRINNDGPYSPENCRWATHREQACNTRRNHRLTCNGKTQTLIEWADEIGLSPSCIAERIKKGWAIEDVLCLPAYALGTWAKRSKNLLSEAEMRMWMPPSEFALLLGGVSRQRVNQISKARKFHTKTVRHRVYLLRADVQAELVRRNPKLRVLITEELARLEAPKS
jgi:hypothetical protein